VYLAVTFEQNAWMVCNGSLELYLPPDLAVLTALKVKIETAKKKFSFFNFR